MQLCSCGAWMQGAAATTHQNPERRPWKGEGRATLTRQRTSAKDHAKKRLATAGDRQYCKHRSGSVSSGGKQSSSAACTVSACVRHIQRKCTSSACKRVLSAGSAAMRTSGMQCRTAKRQLLRPAHNTSALTGDPRTSPAGKDQGRQVFRRRGPSHKCLTDTDKGRRV